MSLLETCASVKMKPIMSGICHLILGKMAIIDRMQANKGKTPLNIRIPRPRVTEDVRPMKILDCLDVMVVGNWMITKSVKEMTNMVVNTDTGTKSITLNS